MLFGTLFALAAVTAAAVYKVTFKLRLGTPRADEVLSLLGTLGLVALFTLPLVLLLAWLRLEDRWWTAQVDWLLIFGSAGVDMIYNTALAFGLASCPSKHSCSFDFHSFSKVFFFLLFIGFLASTRDFRRV